MENITREVVVTEDVKVNGINVGSDVVRENVKQVGSGNVKQVGKENVAAVKENVSELGRENSWEVGRGGGLLAAEAPERDTTIGIETDDV